MITVVTGNKNKAAEVAAFFEGIKISHQDFESIEPQSDSILEIAKEKARQAYEALGIPLIVDDTGFFIEALDGFPGPYASYVQDTIGNAGVLKLMTSVSNRRAYFATAVAYADETGIYVFEGKIDGEITETERGTEGFGYDPIFSVGGITLAEMNMEEKNALSHRGKALKLFRDWYLHVHQRNG